ncbi:MAG: carbohydrate porin [Puniceicoccales bacterium]|nr:carbohydrate porin [Puniceicoccales bacterium]
MPVVPDMPSVVAEAAEKEASAFEPFATFHVEGWHNTAGGVKNTGWWDSLLDAGFTINFEKIGGPAGLSFFANVHWAENRQCSSAFADYTGAANPASNIMAADRARIRLYNFYFSQTWSEGHYTVKLGQLAADDDFMSSDYSALFLNSAFGSMPSQVATPLFRGNSAYPVYAVASPGVWFNWKPGERFSWQTGLYYSGPGQDSHTNYGTDWEHSHEGGILIFSEAAFSTAFGKIPTSFKLGLVAHTAKVANFRRQNSAHEDAVAHGLFSFYAIQDINLIPGKEDATVLGAFWRVGWSPQSDRTVVALYADTGLNWFGPIPSRPDDVLGAGVSMTKYGHSFRDADGEIAGVETTLELTYAAKLTEWWSVQVDTQFLFNPLRREDSGKRKTAVVFGLRSTLSF